MYEFGEFVRHFCDILTNFGGQPSPSAHPRGTMGTTGTTEGGGRGHKWQPRPPMRGGQQEGSLGNNTSHTPVDPKGSADYCIYRAQHLLIGVRGEFRGLSSFCSYVLLCFRYIIFVPSHP